MSSTQSIEQTIQTNPKSEVRNPKSEIRKAAKEMEALFVYELLKVMRETTENLSPESKGLGNETYTGLFDAEVARVMSERGMGLQEVIVNYLERNLHGKEKIK